MPELPEVETVARDLRPRILGATITGARTSWARTLRTHTPEAFAEAVTGRRVEGVGRRAKQIVVELSGGAALTIHLKMTGQLFVVPADTPVDPYVRLVLELADGREIRFRDIRKFGKVGLYGRDPLSGELVAEVGGAAVFASIGPEPLDPGFSVRDFRRRLRRRSGRLKPLLLDQSFIAGVGNIYADEALWASRLHPLRTASTLRPADERHLFDAIRTVLFEAVERRGSSIDDYTAPDGDGSMQERLQVYQRTGEPCPRCGRPIKRMVIGARSTHFCSWCQRLGARDRKGAAAILRTMTGGPRRAGRRWTQLVGEGTLGLTPDEAAVAASRARTERTKRAAATRRAAARASATGGSAAAGASAAGASPSATAPGNDR
jgi:formamidopyrimidine-DNA glycosylase